ncbi:MAG: peptidase M17 [Flavobacteriales bacterium]|nr:peptidase M17 [Flavobacteriales bacterium]|tara:strand:+ start:4353 stop:5717 length:1365 start_codon:yes stop_codon:yes gene_type:complete
MNFKILLFKSDDEKSNWNLQDKYTLECHMPVKWCRNGDHICAEGSKIHTFLVNLNKGYSKRDRIKTVAVNVNFENKKQSSIFKSRFLEGFYLSNYDFNRHKTTFKKNGFSIKTKLDNITESVVRGVCVARDLVNEPLSHLNAEQLSKSIKKLSKEAGFKLEVLEETTIHKLKMGGVLSVNKGSIAKPTFNILTYKSKTSKKKVPTVLVGKGVMYDTGGLSLKPTPNSMDMMKCDMGGAAAVIGTIYALARAKVNCYVVGLIPAVENRPGGEAYVPGDVITMMSGATVEVLNTDAEGRLILADALHYAKRYKPELVIDLATLTGAASRAIGKYGVVAMENYNNEVFTDFSNSMKKLLISGNLVGERVAVQPFWDDYKDDLNSSVADIKNLGGAEAGHITAGKFLEHFVAYPWMHLDIAGSAFLKQDYIYQKRGGTGVGVRLLLAFFENKYRESDD